MPADAPCFDSITPASGIVTYRLLHPGDPTGPPTNLQVGLLLVHLLDGERLRIEAVPTQAAPAAFSANAQICLRQLRAGGFRSVKRQVGGGAIRCGRRDGELFQYLSHILIVTLTLPAAQDIQRPGVRAGAVRHKHFHHVRSFDGDRSFERRHPGVAVCEDHAHADEARRAGILTKPNQSRSFAEIARRGRFRQRDLLRRPESTACRPQQARNGQQSGRRDRYRTHDRSPTPGAWSRVCYWGHS